MQTSQNNYIWYISIYNDIFLLLFKGAELILNE